MDPQRKGSFVSGSRCLCQISSKSVKNCDRECADRQTDRDDRGDLIICVVLCYSNGTDNQVKSSIAFNYESDKRAILQCNNNSKLRQFAKAEGLCGVSEGR